MGLSPAKSVELERGMEVEVKSPCVGKCTLNLADVCTGCQRTREEISRWYVMSNKEKRQVVERFK